MYQNARQSTLDELLLGDVKLRSEIEVLKNFGTTSGSESTMERETLFDSKNKKVTSDDVQATVKSARGSAYQLPEGVTHIRRGSVLDDGWWWPFKNDAWVIGGVHGLKRFHLAMAKASDDLLWDASSKRPRVLGRELLGLAAFGYSLIGVPGWSKKSPPPATTTVTPVSPTTTTTPPAVKTTPVGVV